MKRKISCCYSSLDFIFLSKGDFDTSYVLGIITRIFQEQNIHNNPLYSRNRIFEEDCRDLTVLSGKFHDKNVFVFTRVSYLVWKRL